MWALLETSSSMGIGLDGYHQVWGYPSSIGILKCLELQFYIASKGR